MVLQRRNCSPVQYMLWRMQSSGLRRRVHRIATIIRVEGISELGTTLTITSSLILFTLMMEAICSSEMSALTRATRRHTPADRILDSHLRENLK
jgi:hypothetical protein